MLPSEPRKGGKRKGRTEGVDVPDIALCVCVSMRSYKKQRQGDVRRRQWSLFWGVRVEKCVDRVYF